MSPVLLAFLQQEFRGSGGGSGIRPQEQLVAQLVELLQTHAPFPDPEEASAADEQTNDLSTRARRSLISWTNQGFLIRGQDDAGQEWYDLTPATGQTLLWLDTLDNPAFVATESRFLDIVRKLQELVQNSAADKATRLAELHRRQAQLAAEIAALEAADELPTYTDSRINWEVASISQLGKTLREDFRTVNESFQALIKNLYERQLQGTGSRGQTLGFALDSRETLKQQDQGRSFYTFWEFLTDPVQQDELHTLITATYQLLHERNLPADDFLLHLRAELFDAAQLVREASLGLTERLHRLITEHDAGQRQRSRVAYLAITQLALQARPAPPAELPALTVASRLQLGLPLSKGLPDTLHEPPAPPATVAAPAVAPILLADDLAQLFAQRTVDRRRLGRNIATVLAAQGGQATLLEVVDRYPLELGLAEALAYLALAARETRHQIDAATTVLLPLGLGHPQALRVPLVTFFA
ncbi:DUF3375 family protein [Hymenobacter sp. BRD128]|nr:DUF3375 family protein [Hymenobacter sp. BRD128]